MYLWSCDHVNDRTQVRRGPPDSSPQQTGTSRTVKRYPSSSGPITSNALPNGNGYANGRGSEHRNRHGHRNGPSNGHHNTNRPTSNSQMQGQFNNALSPAGKNKKHIFCTRLRERTWISMLNISLSSVMSKQTLWLN